MCCRKDRQVHAARPETWLEYRLNCADCKRIAVALRIGRNAPRGHCGERVVKWKRIESVDQHRYFTDEPV